MTDRPPGHRGWAACSGRGRSRNLPLLTHWGPTTGDLAAELRRNGTLQYRLRSRIDGVGYREGAVRLRIKDILAVLEKAADVLTAGT